MELPEKFSPFLGSPDSWLVLPLPWTGGKAEVCECAFATSPSIRRIVPGLSGEVIDVLELAEMLGQLEHEHLKRRIVLFGDITRWLAQFHETWTDRGIDAAAVQAEIIATIPGVRLDMMSVGHMSLVMADQSDSPVRSSVGRYILGERHRSVARSFLLQYLELEWPAFVDSVVYRDEPEGVASHLV